MYTRPLLGHLLTHPVEIVFTRNVLQFFTLLTCNDKSERLVGAIIYNFIIDIWKSPESPKECGDFMAYF